jgi:hypothetical protein
MDDQIIIYSVSSGFNANHLITISETLFTELSEKFKSKDEDCEFMVVIGLDHTLGDSYEFYSYKIFDSNFVQVNILDGIYKLTKLELKETWAGKWSNKILSLQFESDRFDKYEVNISSSVGHLKTVQQIAFVLEAIYGRQTKLNAVEAAEIRSNIDGYLNLKRI